MIFNGGVWIDGGGEMKKRVQNARQGSAGVIAVEQACNRLDQLEP
jgi:hypothetical protein